jgi:transcriptional regulator with XRE-family HTH domain
MWDQQAFKYRVRLMMYYNDWTQVGLARRLKIRQSTLSGWLNSPSNLPDLNRILDLARVLKVEPCWLAYACKKCKPSAWDRLEKELKAMKRP